VIRACAELIAAVGCFLMAALTAIYPPWLEFSAGVDPDGGSGATEWTIVLGLGVCASVLGITSLRHYRLALRRPRGDMIRD
jgi:hypothetical protein